MIWRIPGISLNLHYPKEDDGELYTACPIIKGSRGIEPLNPLPQRRIRLTLPAYLCLKTALRRSEIREYYRILLVFLCSFAIVSCVDDNDVDYPDTKLIKGQWQLVEDGDTDNQLIYRFTTDYVELIFNDFYC